MTGRRDPYSHFRRTLWCALAAVVALVIVFASYVVAEKRIDFALGLRHESIRLAGEMRQSSDDLTRMVRTYVLTGDLAYKRHYREIVAIRDGTAPRPRYNHNVYWDLVLADDARPVPSGDAAALLDLMRVAGFSAAELAKLVESKRNSDRLVRTEAAAIALFESDPGDSAARERARGMLHDAAYHRAKADIMRPLAEFTALLEQRTQGEVAAAKRTAWSLCMVVVLLSAVLAWLLLRSHGLLLSLLGGSVDTVRRQIACLGRGNFSMNDESSTPERDSVLGWIAVARERLVDSEGQRDEIEQALRRRESLLRAVVDNTPLEYWARDAEGAGILENEAFVRHWGKLEALGPQGVNATEGKWPGWTAFSRSVSGGDVLENEFSCVVAGQRRIFQQVVAPIRVGSAIVGVLGLNQDVTEREQAQAELRQHRDRLEELVAERTAELADATLVAEAASRAKSAFLANMSHEIRTPINAITGMAYLIRRSGVTPEQAQRLDKLEDAGKHLVSVINAVLDLSKIEAGKLELAQERFTAPQLVENVASMIRPAADAKGIALVVDCEVTDQVLLGDLVRLQQAILNYCSNALKFTATGSVTLVVRSVAQNEDSVLLRVEVHDTGIGIDEDTLGRLFNAFEQADSSTTRRYGGTGLGLAIARRIAEAMGGQAGASSVPGQGSRFWLSARLRRAAVADTPATVATGSHAGPADPALQGGAGRVLLVDDEPVNREIGLLLLEQVGIGADVAQDGLEAIALVERNDYGLVLMDMQMPNMDGLEATRRIRRMPGRERLPIVALTANAFADDRVRCIEAGMNDFVGKPVVPDILFAAVSKWLGATID